MVSDKAPEELFELVTFEGSLQTDLTADSLHMGVIVMVMVVVIVMVVTVVMAGIVVDVRP